jgi:hypothetical protein
LKNSSLTDPGEDFVCLPLQLKMIRIGVCLQSLP